ncbi:MAG: epoxyqueuosine reductase [Candidatus Cloacimonadota bacterium]|nr:epoxyqueuosine reductase [Candidatus Cloacimonadota bacterium]
MIIPPKDSFHKQKILIHSCCAPCLIAPYYRLKEAGHRVSVYWFNPNIHPLREYQLRRDTLRDFAVKESFELVEVNEYGLHDFLQHTRDDIARRCEYCYKTRIEAVAKAARAGGYDAFSTTLLYSKYQDHDSIRHFAQEMSISYQIEFFYEDWRELWQEGIRLSKAAGMYRQQYCGCIFSEEERYRGKI